MKNNKDFLKEAWENLANIQKDNSIVPDLWILLRTEWSYLFESLMRNRLIQGAFRYGLLHSLDKPQYDRVSSMERRLKLYKETGNTELLVDITNLALMEFEEGIHPNKHFKVETGEHCTTLTNPPMKG